MTEREAKIRERCEKATQGPWQVWDKHPFPGVGVLDGTGKPMVFQRHEDLHFVVHAREDIPWLLDQLASARAEGEKLAQLQNDVGRAMGFMNHVDSLAVYRLLQAALDRSKA